MLHNGLPPPCLAHFFLALCTVGTIMCSFGESGVEPKVQAVVELEGHSSLMTTHKHGRSGTALSNQLVLLDASCCQGSRRAGNLVWEPPTLSKQQHGRNPSDRIFSRVHGSGCVTPAEYLGCCAVPEALPFTLPEPGVAPLVPIPTAVSLGCHPLVQIKHHKANNKYYSGCMSADASTHSSSTG